MKEKKRSILVFISKIEKIKIALTHWGYFELWDLTEITSLLNQNSDLFENKQTNLGTFTNFFFINDQVLFALHKYLMYLKFGFGRATQDAGI